MPRFSRTHGALLGELGSLIANHLAKTGDQCSAVTLPGIIPQAHAGENFRVPGLAVTCIGYETEVYDVSNPVLIVEILSPSNRLETWRNVWSYTTIPSLREIVILSSTAIRAVLLRRDEDGNWPATPTVIEDGDLILDSIWLRVPLAVIYRTTRLTRD